jgi:hypothetical protein
MTDDIKEKLAAAKAARAKLAEEAAAKAAEAAPAETLAAEELALANETAIAAAAKEYGKRDVHFGVVEALDGRIVIVKRANPVAFRKFISSDLEGAAALQEMELLVRPCRVYPDAPAFDRLLDDLPATLVDCATAVSRLSGVRAKERGKK